MMTRIINRTLSYTLKIRIFRDIDKINQTQPDTLKMDTNDT